MRTKNFLRNSIFSLSSYMIILLIGFITRRVFLQTFSTEYLGYEGLFGNIFSLMSLAELGVGGVISYSLYRELAKQNQVQVAKLMSVYRYIYKWIGIGVATMGFGLVLFLPQLIQEEVVDWRYVYIIYFTQLAVVLCSYFLAYRRTLLLADQKEYVCVQVDTVVNTTSALLKLVAMVVFKSYLAYLLLGVVNNIVANAIIHRQCGREYPYIKKRTLFPKEDFDNLHLASDIKNYFTVKVAGLVYGATDNVVITIMLGVRSVGLMSNYMLIFTSVNAIILKLIGSVQAGIGNLVYSDQMEIGKKMYYGLDTLLYLVGSFTTVCFFVLMEPFITLWIGEQFILPTSCLVALCVNYSIGYAGETAYRYRAAFGNYHEDRIAMIGAAVSNLGLSILLAPVLGLTGIVIGTIVGQLFFYYARVKYVFKHYLKTSLWLYVGKQLLFVSVTYIEVGLTYYLTKNMPITIVGLAMRLGVCLVVPNVINLLLLYRTAGFRTIIDYAKQSITILWGYAANRIKRK